MKNTTSRIFWLIIIVAAIIPTIYFFLHITDPAFRDSAMGNWFATMIGALAGILIALEINRIQQNATEKKEDELRENEEKKHQIKILGLVKKELEYNLLALSERQPNKDEKTKRKVLVNRLKDEMWNAFSDGGELQWIRDLSLLDFISTAYYHIRTIIFLEEKYFEVVHFPGMKVHQDKYPQDFILEYLTATDNEVIQSIEQALREIESNLKMPVGKVNS